MSTPSRRICLALLLCSLCPALAGQSAPVLQPPRFEFKGDKLGMSLSEFKSRHELDLRHSDCDDTRPLGASIPDPDDKVSLGIVECEMDVYIVDRHAKAASYKFLDGKLYSILVNFPHDAFSDVLAAMRGKYGAETKGATETFQNAFGAHYSGHVSLWRQGTDTVTLREHQGDVTTSAMMMLDNKADDSAKARIRKNKPDF